MIVVQDAKTRAVMDAVSELAVEPYATLILGEPGSGRGTIARQLHERGPLRLASFREMGCHGLASLESIVNAAVGTLFLRDIERLRADVQESLCAVIDDLSDGRRILASGPPDLGAAVSRGEFSPALYSSIGRGVLHVPPMRERPADIPALVAAFAGRPGESDTPPLEVAESAMGYLLNYDWPGNVRELAQLIGGFRERNGGGVLSAEDLPPQIRWFSGNGGDRQVRSKAELGFNPLSEEFQFQLIADALRRTHVR